MKINIKLIKDENAHVTTRSIGSQILENLRKIKNFNIFFDFFYYLSLSFENPLYLNRHSTSHPCGNQVDGLPHDVHTKTVAKPGRLGPLKNDDTRP